MNKIIKKKSGKIKKITSENCPALKEAEDALNAYFEKTKNQECSNCIHGTIIVKGKNKTFSCKHREEIDDWCKYWKKTKKEIIKS